MKRDNAAERLRKQTAKAKQAYAKASKKIKNKAFRGLKAVRPRGFYIQRKRGARLVMVPALTEEELRRLKETESDKDFTAELCARLKEPHSALFS